MQISIISPLYNEAESLPELHSWIKKVMDKNKFSYEIIFIDDGSTDNSWEIVEKLSKSFPEVKGIKFQRNYGKSAGLNRGFNAAQGDVIITMDADLQDSPEEIPELYNMVTDGNYDLVSGWKKKRFDPLSKTIPTKLYNGTTRMMSGIKLNDMNCGLKAYKKAVIKSVEVYGEMHRYIPVLAKQAGFGKIGEKVVQHQERKYGVTKFGLERFINGPLDLMSVLFITKFGKRPMHIFGYFGTAVFALGFFLTMYVIGLKAYYLYSLQEQAPLVTDSPLFYLALVAMIIGTQLFLAGFLGELIARSSADRNSYLIEKEINL
ncbi:MAG: glycosyltransferase involved in cell wall biosynthesis [Flavobacteriaceae bacterium]|jgi:glycosyltransferase involved in cell wall biosynthesis